MGSDEHDLGTETFLDLDGQILVIDSKGEYCVRYSVQRVERSPERPHGLNYSLTLHGPDGRRLIGFDNAHAVRQSRGPGGKRGRSADHKHRMDEIRPYRFQDAPTLLTDFWAEVDAYLKEKGVR